MDFGFGTVPVVEGVEAEVGDEFGGVDAVDGVVGGGVEL